MATAQALIHCDRRTLNCAGLLRNMRSTTHEDAVTNHTKM